MLRSTLYDKTLNVAVDIIKCRSAYRGKPCIHAAYSPAPPFLPTLFQLFMLHLSVFFEGRPPLALLRRSLPRRPQLPLRTAPLHRPPHRQYHRPSHQPSRPSNRAGGARRLRRDRLLTSRASGHRRPRNSSHLTKRPLRSRCLSSSKTGRARTIRCVIDHAAFVATVQ